MTPTITTADRKAIALSTELNEVLMDHIQNTFLSDSYNRKQLSIQGFITPHTELLQDELEEEGNDTLVKELSALPAEFRYYA